MSLIDREAENQIYRRESWGFAIKCVQTVEDAPTIEPEQKKGKWVWDENGMDWGLGAWRCSECHTKAETWWANDEKYNPLRCSGGNFCGNCGAKMGAE